VSEALAALLRGLGAAAATDATPWEKLEAAAAVWATPPPGARVGS
jgi:hypothetical protein